MTEPSRLWNSSTVAHATRWDLDLPDRQGVFGYMADVLSRQIDRLGGGIELPARYFYELSIRHEDMHVEALAYTRQTLRRYSNCAALSIKGLLRRRCATTTSPTSLVNLVGCCTGDRRSWPP
jgi:hypothetical protein